MQAERRILRSTEPSRAIRIFLAKNAGEPGLKAAAVASDDGLLLGGVGDEDLDALAALGCAKGAGHDVAERCEHQGWGDEALFTRRINIGEDTFTIASVGAPLHATTEVEALLGRLLAA